jgi:hypothetical protein
MADKVYSSIIDAFLDDREPDWKAVGLDTAKKEGETQLDRTHKYVDDAFMDEIAESSSHHTPVPPTGKSAAKPLAERMREKERAASRISSAPADWQNMTATQHPEDYRSSLGDNQSLMDEVAMSIEQAGSGNNFKENRVQQKEWSDGQVQKYVRDLLNQGTPPNHVAAKLEKLAEIELFNHQMATDYLQREAGLLGMAFLEPNTYMDKNSPTYERGSGKFGAAQWKCEDCDQEGVRQSNGKIQCSNCAKKSGVETPRSATSKADFLYNRAEHPGGSRFGSNDCVRQHSAWKQAGIKVRAKSVKQITACEGCSYFSKAAGQKTCNLYHLPVVGNAQELTAVINRITAGVPTASKKAALVQIANRNDEHVLEPKASSMVSRPEGYDIKQAERQKRVMKTNAIKFDSSHVAKLHEAGASLERIYGWAEQHFGTFDTGRAMKEFTLGLKKNAKGKIVLAERDYRFLRSIGLRSEAFVGAAKCASCLKHISGVVKQASLEEQDYDSRISRVPAKFAEQTPDTVRREARKTGSIDFNAKVVEKLHNAGHAMEKIYNAGASKVGSAQASKAVKDFIAGLKHGHTKVALSQIDCTFLKSKLGVHNAIVGAEKCGSCVYRTGMHCGLTGGTLLSYPGMDKQSSNHKIAAGAPEDGRSILGEYDLIAPVQQADIDTDGPSRMDVEPGGKMEIE